jgi:hypothetical protein
MTETPTLKPVAKMTRKQLEKEAKAIEDVKLVEPPKDLPIEGLRSAVRLHRRRRGITSQ